MSKTTLLSRVLWYMAAGLACAPGFAWAQADALKHDPFARPAFLKAPPPPASQPGDIGGVGKAALPEPPWQPELAAVVVAGPKSMVSIDGAIVRIGEEIKGHRLVEVREQTAVFVKDRKRVTLTLRGLHPAPEAPPAGKDGSATTVRRDAPPKLDAPPKPDDRGTAERRNDRKPEEK